MSMHEVITNEARRIQMFKDLVEGIEESMEGVSKLINHFVKVWSGYDGDHKQIDFEYESIKYVQSSSEARILTYKGKFVPKNIEIILNNETVQIRGRKKPVIDIDDLHFVACRIKEFNVRLLEHVFERVNPFIKIDSIIQNLKEFFVDNTI